MRIHTVLIITLLAALIGCGGGAKQGPKVTAFQAAASTPTSASASAEKPQYADVGPMQLQAAVMAFADTSNARLAEAAAIIEDIGTPQARLTAARMMVYNIASNVEIASGPYPGIALLDLIVVSSLRRMVWEDYWVPLFGPESEEALVHIREIEEDIWEAAAKVLTAKQLDDLAKIILQWRHKHPKQISVNYVRFSDFGELGLQPHMRKLSQPGGLFASVKEAAMVAQDVKVAIDRAFYLMSRMQIVINGQIKLAYLEMMFQPEADGIVDQTKRVAGITERYAEIAEKLPEELGAETTKLIDHLFLNLSRNRDETFAAVMAGLNQWQDQTVREVMTSISTERQAAIEQAIQGLAQQQVDIYDRMDELVERSGEEFKESLDHAFLLGVLFIAIFFISLTLYRVLVVRPLNRRKQ